MLLAIAGALLPILFVVGLDWLAARTGTIPGSAAGHFAAFVVTFALPLSLFLAAANAKPSDLSNVAYILSFVIGLIGTFGVGIALDKLVFKHDLRASAVQGLSCGFPNMAYCSPPVLGAVVVGPAGILAVLVGNLVTSLIMLPIALVLLHGGGKQQGAGPVLPAAIGQEAFGGVYAHGIVPGRPGDSAGVSVSWFEASRYLTAMQKLQRSLGEPVSTGLGTSILPPGDVQSHEIVLEARYAAKLSTGVLLTSDLKYVIRPNETAQRRNATVAELQVLLDF